MKVALAYGEGSLELDLPRDRATVIRPARLPAAADARAAVAAALRAPVAGPPLRKIVRPGQTVAISVCDGTRGQPRQVVIPAVLDELDGVTALDDVVLLVATGTHRGNTGEELRAMLGTEVVDAVRVLNHDARDPASHVWMGELGAGVPVWLDRAWVEADVRITTGFVEPHFFAGFSGGPKMVAPGLAALETVLTLHDAARIGHPKARWGVLDGNPVHEDVRAIAARDRDRLHPRCHRRSRRTPGRGVRRRARRDARSRLRGREGGCDAGRFRPPSTSSSRSNSGFPLDQNLYQAVKGMSAAAQVVKAGGTIVCAAECRDGFPDHGSYRSELASAASPQALLEAIAARTETVPDQWQVQIQASIQRRAARRRAHLLPLGRGARRRAPRADGRRHRHGRGRPGCGRAGRAGLRPARGAADDPLPEGRGVGLTVRRPGSSAPKILVIGTLDTKGDEISYLRGRVEALGAEALVLDTGIMGEPPEGCDVDIGRAAVAGAAGVPLEDVQAADTRGAAVEIMTRGIRAVTLDLWNRGALQGVVCLGGAEGALLGAAAMHALPVGVPKVLVSPSASGRRQFAPFVGTKDVLVMHSVIDILGLNPIARSVFDNAAAAVVGMVRDAGTVVEGLSGRSVGVTMLGQTTPGVMHLRAVLAEAGFEAVIFHANGVGGPAMEELVEERALVGVIDYTLSELANTVKDGIHAVGPSRLTVAGSHGLPQLVALGCCDFFNQGPRDTVPAEYRSRKTYDHNPVATLVRLLPEEMVELGKMIASRLNTAIGPVHVLAPTGGFSLSDSPGGDLWDPEADEALIATLERELDDRIPVERVGGTANDRAFAELAAERYLAMQSRPA